MGTDVVNSVKVPINIGQQHLVVSYRYSHHFAGFEPAHLSNFDKA